MIPERDEMVRLLWNRKMCRRRRQRGKQSKRVKKGCKEIVLSSEFKNQVQKRRRKRKRTKGILERMENEGTWADQATRSPQKIFYCTSTSGERREMWSGLLRPGQAVTSFNYANWVAYWWGLVFTPTFPHRAEPLSRVLSLCFSTAGMLSAIALKFPFLRKMPNF